MALFGESSSAVLAVDSIIFKPPAPTYWSCHCHSSRPCFPSPRLNQPTSQHNLHKATARVQFSVRLPTIRHFHSPSTSAHCLPFSICFLPFAASSTTPPPLWLKHKSSAKHKYFSSDNKYIMTTAPRHFPDSWPGPGHLNRTPEWMDAGWSRTTPTATLDLACWLGMEISEPPLGLSESGIPYRIYGISFP